jgi:hypothetical protein
MDPNKHWNIKPAHEQQAWFIVSPPVVNFSGVLGPPSSDFAAPDADTNTATRPRLEPCLPSRLGAGAMLGRETSWEAPRWEAANIYWNLYSLQCGGGEEASRIRGEIVVRGNGRRGVSDEGRRRVAVLRGCEWGMAVCKEVRNIGRPRQQKQIL